MRPWRLAAPNRACDSRAEAFAGVAVRGGPRARHAELVVSAARDSALCSSIAAGRTDERGAGCAKARTARRAAVVPSRLGLAEASEPRWRYVADAVRAAAGHLEQ